MSKSKPRKHKVRNEVGMVLDENDGPCARVVVKVEEVHGLHVYTDNKDDEAYNRVTTTTYDFLSFEAQWDQKHVRKMIQAMNGKRLRIEALEETTGG